MIFPSDCHVHTPYCDGRAKMEAMAARAYELGYTSLGFSPHSPLPYANSFFGMHPKSEALYRAKIQELQLLYRQKMDILMGIEWDLDTNYAFPRYDYRIGSVHRLNCGRYSFEVDCTKEELVKGIRDAFGGDVNAFATAYFSEVERSAMRRGVDIVGHFDLPTKFNSPPEVIDETDAEYREIALNALRRIAKARPDLVFEVNTGAMSRLNRTSPYPAPFLLREMAKLGLRITLTSDAHTTDGLAFWQEGALALCRRSGVRKLVYLTKDGFKPFPLR